MKRNTIQKIIMVLSLLAMVEIGQAQIVGNKNIVTKTYSLEEVYRINIQMYAKVFIDMDKEAGIEITGESNLLEYIDKKVKRGILTFDQKKWIEPTTNIIIKIGAPGLRELEMGTHDKTVVSNINGEIFKVDAPIGDIQLEGAVEELRIKSKMSRVDATKLIAKSASIDIKRDGQVSVNVSQTVDCDIDEDGFFENINESASSNDCDGHSEVVNLDTKWINVKIKNNSWKRNHFVVVGPKPDGRKFSYGFPMMPLQSKSERWTVGTKVYKENSIGQRKLLVTLKEDDENETVKLFVENNE